MVLGAFGVSAMAFAVGFTPLFPVVLIALFLMGTSDGLTIVSENGIMQRRTPDAVRSRTMAAFEAVISLGLAVSYLLAGPVLEVFGPRSTYRIGGVTAGLAALALLPLLKLRREAPTPEPAPARYTSAEELDAITAPVLDTTA
jgi:MFS family permease